MKAGFAVRRNSRSNPATYIVFYDPGAVRPNAGFRRSSLPRVARHIRAAISRLDCAAKTWLLLEFANAKRFIQCALVCASILTEQWPGVLIDPARVSCQVQLLRQHFPLIDMTSNPHLSGNSISGVGENLGISFYREQWRMLRVTTLGGPHS
jgi:hypothetical protein